MRIGVLDIGSNTGHLLVVDAFRGAPPLPAHTFKQPLRLAEHLDDDGAVTAKGVASLIEFVRDAQETADDRGCTDMLAFATSAVRDAANSDDVLSRVRDETGVELVVLAGDDEARLTFLAVRRWFGWSSGRLGVFDIGGGSLEIATGSDESPTAALSLPLGAGRLTRAWIPKQPVDRDTVKQLRRHVRAEVAAHAGALTRSGGFDHAVATSKTFRTLARLCGAAPTSEGPRARRVLTLDALCERLDRLPELTVDEIADLPGVSSGRAHQVLAGGLVAEAVLDLFELDELQICPWALREGVILERLDSM